jgi:predicted DNA-binding mobile mystery protein A
MARTSKGPAARVRLSYRRSRLLRISAELESWRAAAAAQSGRVPRPAHGWIRYIRDALNMNAFQLGRRADLRQPTVARLEQKERDETITLGALRRLAHALSCDLVYVVVPRRTLMETVDEQVRRAVDAAQRDPRQPATDPEELGRALLVQMPRWIWGSWDYPELFCAVDAERPHADAQNG